jgi:hypothetical protein
MDTGIRAYDLFWDLYRNNDSFRNVIDSGMESGMISFFSDDLWDRIKSQNFISYDDRMKEFIDMFLLGYNIGNCVGASRQLSYSFNDVDIVSGVLPILKGTLNAEKEGGHCWLENDCFIIDTSLMLIIDKSLRDDLGYIEENRITKECLKRSQVYQARKDFVNDALLRKK